MPKTKPESLYHVYIGAKYLGPQRATSLSDACIRYGEKHKLNAILLRAETQATVQNLKRAKTLVAKGARA